MTIVRRLAFIALPFALFGYSQGAVAACDQTLNPGANVVSAVTSAPAGTTICLNSGDYGTTNFSGIRRTGLVKVMSTTGIGAAMSPKISNSAYIRIESMTLRDVSIQSCSTNIQIAGNTWAQNSTGISVFDHGYNCPATNKQILIDGNTMVNVRPAWSEGKIGLIGVNGVVISNNLIKGHSAGNGGDGIQTGGSLANIMIGPGNIFRDIRQAACDSSPGVPHCDAVQFVGDCPSCTINGNWFDNVEVVLQHHDAVVPVVFTNNLVTNAVQMWAYSTPGSASNSRIEHNTFYNLGLAMWGTNGSGKSDTTGLVARNNIIVGSGNGPSTCSTPSCVFASNMCQTASQCSFTTSNALVAAPVFVGGAPAAISSWAGWQLSAASPGYRTGSDAKDIGTTYYGAGTATNPVPVLLGPPSGLRVQ